MHDQPYPTQEQLNNDIVDDFRKYCPVRIIVAGSRSFNNYSLFKEELEKYLADFTQPYIFYSGMAKKGADALIVRYCEEDPDKRRYLEYPADWDSFGKGAGFVRNSLMAASATHLIAFYDDKSNGTKHMINKAKARSLPVTVIHVTPDTPNAYELYTIQMGQWRKAKALNIKVVDTTLKSGVRAFAPSPELLSAYKSGRVNDQDYTTNYLEQMAQSRIDNPKFWDHLTKFHSMAFACYCGADDFCHRKLFVQEVKKYLEELGHEVVMKGEIT